MSSKGKGPKPLDSALLWLSKGLRKAPDWVQLGLAFLLSKYHFGVLFSAFVISIISYWNVLPGIFQDEYVYSMEARKLEIADQSYPNYLFSILFKTTNLCSAAFYSCSKGINSVLLAGLLVFIYLISRTIHSERASALLTAIVALSPTTVFASFFMPEMLFFLLNTIAIWALIRILAKPSKFYWVLFCLSLGLALLTKRHELFILPGFVLASFWILRTRGLGLIPALLVSLSTGFVVPILIRQFVVLLLTGQPWAGLLGSTYANSFRESTGTNGGSENQTSVLNLLTQGFWHNILHVAVLLLMGLAFVNWSNLGKSSPGENEGPESNSGKTLEIIVLSLAFSIVPIVVFFEAYLTQSGDNHTFRLLARYFEFLFPLIMLLAARKANDKIFASNRRIWLVLVFASYVLFMFVIGPFFSTGPSDSPTIHGLKLVGPAILIFFAATVLILLFKKVSKYRVFKGTILAMIVPALVLSAGLATRVDLREGLGTELSYFDRAGIYVKNNLDFTSGEELLVIGRTRTEIVATKFAVDQPGIRHSIQPEQSKKLSEKKLQGVRHVVVLFPTALVTNALIDLVYEGEGFLVYAVRR